MPHSYLTSTIEIKDGIFAGGAFSVCLQGQLKTRNRHELCAVCGLETCCNLHDLFNTLNNDLDDVVVPLPNQLKCLFRVLKSKSIRDQSLHIDLARGN